MSQNNLELRLRILIVDDEFRSRSSLRILLGHHFPYLEIVAEADSVQSAIASFVQHQPDLVFLDVELPDGTAFDFLEVLKDKLVNVIIISAHPEHSLRAFKFATLHYLLKPIDLDDLKEAISRISSLPRLETNSAKKQPNHEEKIALPSIEGYKIFAINDIVYCESKSNYTLFHFADKSTYLVSNTLGYYENLFLDKAFFRVHNQFLVHLLHIKAYYRGRGGWLEMSNGKSVEVASRKRDSFLEKLNTYTKGL